MTTNNTIVNHTALIVIRLHAEPYYFCDTSFELKRINYDRILNIGRKDKIKVAIQLFDRIKRGGK